MAGYVPGNCRGDNERLLIYLRLGRFPRSVLLIAQALGDSQAMAAKAKSVGAGSCTIYIAIPNT